MGVQNSNVPLETQVRALQAASAVLDSSFRSNESEPAGGDAASSPATSFVQRFVKRGGELTCVACRKPARQLPHHCKEWGAR